MLYFHAVFFGQNSLVNFEHKATNKSETEGVRMQMKLLAIFTCMACDSSLRCILK